MGGEERESGLGEVLPGRAELAGASEGWRPVSPAKVMVLVVGWLLCAFGGQRFGLENSHGWVSVVKYVLMNEPRRELWRVVFSVQGATVDVEMKPRPQ